jgi:anaerobic selenocysteine-containing dehydrogenase
MDPMGESVSYDEICLELAKRLKNGDGPSLPKGIAGVVETMVARIEGLGKDGGLDHLKQRGVWIDGKEEQAYHAYKKKGFATPSGTFELYSTRLAAQGSDPLPACEPPGQANSPALDEFILVRYTAAVHAPLLTANAKWAQEIAHDNRLWVNPEAAKRLKIGDGDLVTVTSKAGTVQCRMHVRQGVHPQVVALAAGAGHKGYGHVAQAEPFRSDDPDTALLWWDGAGNGVNVNRLIPFKVDPIGRGQAWMGTKVTIRKI